MVEIMRWYLRLKLEQRFGPFYNLLTSAGDRPIVERSRRDRFWGAVPNEDGVLEGQNMLGRLLLELRDQTVAWMAGEEDGEEWPALEPLPIDKFTLLGRPIEEF